MSKTLVRVLVAVALLVSAATFPPPAQAAPFWRFINYYDGCDGNLTLVGTATRNCSGQWTYSGQQSGHWKEVNDVSCSGPPVEYTYNYEYCNGAWVSVSELGSCSC